MTATCIGRHDDDPPLTTHGMLCARCHGRLARALADIVALYPTLAVVVMLSGNPSGGSRGKPGSRPPCNVDVIDLTDPRGETHAQIAGWTRIVIEERRLAAQPADIEQAARLLTIHLDWIAEQPWCDEALLEISNVAYRIRRACNDLPDPPIGTCPDIDPRGETDRCGGPLRWIDGSTAVTCSRCGSSWSEADLPHILRVVEPTRKFPVSRDWVAMTYGVAAGTLRQWVRRGHVRTYSDEQVDLFDVLTRVQGE
jgi:hypothetical protein